MVGISGLANRIGFESCLCANHPSVLQESQMMDRVRARALQAGRVGRPGARGPGP